MNVKDFPFVSVRISKPHLVLASETAFCITLDQLYQPLFGEGLLPSHHFTGGGYFDSKVGNLAGFFRSRLHDKIKRRIVQVELSIA